VPISKWLPASIPAGSTSATLSTSVP
jgi:hypothetical protein